MSRLYPFLKNALYLASFRSPAKPVTRSEPRNILLLLPMKGVGDIVLAGPAVCNVKEQWPGSRLEVVAVNRTALDLAARLLPADRYHLWSFDWRKDTARGVNLLLELRKTRFDAVVDFMCDHTVSSAVFAFLVGSPLTAGFSCSRRKVFFNCTVDPDWTSSHMVDDWHRLAGCFGVQNVTGYPHLTLSDDEILFVKAFIQRENLGTESPLVVIHPGARDDLSRVDKRWNWRKYRNLCHTLIERTAAKVVIVGSADEKDLCAAVAELPGGDVIDMCGSTVVLETLAIIGVSDLFIGNNSGPLHLACALDVPTISFSGGINMVRWAPRGSSLKNRIMMPGPDCSASKCAECPVRGRQCLDRVSVTDVAEEALSLLGRRENFRRDSILTGESSEVPLQGE